MATDKIDPLRPDLRWLREVQAPQQIKPVSSDPVSFRVSSAAFKLGRDGTISGDLEQSFVNAGQEITSRYPSLPRAVALVAHTVGTIVELGMSVAHAPIEGNEHHAELAAAGLQRRKLEAAARTLAETCEIIDPIDVAEAIRLSGLQ